MEDEDVLLDRTHSVLRLLGELRQMVFAHEVRNTRRDEPPRPHPLTRMERLEQEGGGPSRGGADVRERERAREADPSLRIVREALDLERELMDRLTDPPEGEPED
jgi:hypothetical protein